jgi:hypothetical protein
LRRPLFVSQGLLDVVDGIFDAGCSAGAVFGIPLLG